jgi:ribonuclease I
MRTRKYEGPTAIESARLNLSEARTLCTHLQTLIRTFEDDAELNPKNWGYAGQGADVRCALEEIAISLDSDSASCDSEAENHRAIRVAAGLPAEAKAPGWKS